MTEYLIMGLSVLGAAFILLAAIGILRMPDLYLRISVTTKAATLGTGLILTSVAVYFGEAGISSRVVAIILFTLLTAPVAAHLIGKASYFTGTPIWEKSVVDDLKGRYRPDSGPQLSEEEKASE
ncbi:MAG: monovalent cation/H(+) antiporter subunit G [Bacteroidota bacterium]